MRQEYIISQVENKIGTISIYNKKGNSMTNEMLECFINEINVLSKEDINCIIIKSDYEGVFCSGASFDELIKAKNFIQAEDFFFGFANAINTMRKSSKIIISKINGKVVGGGVGIVCASDYSIATNISKVRLSELSIGIGPFVIKPAIERRVGSVTFSEMALFPKQWKESKWCEENKIYNKVINSEEELEKEIIQIKEDFSTYSIEALSKLKKSLWENTKNWDSFLYRQAGISAKLSISKEVQDYFRKIKNKT